MTRNPTDTLFGGSIQRVTDDELVRLAQDGDAGAFDQLVVRHQAAIYRAALAALRNPEDAEEVAQDAFIRGWRSLQSFRGESSLRTWLLTIAWKRAMSRRRSLVRWWQRRAELDAEHEPSADTRTDSDLAARELSIHIATAIRGLSPTLRDALLLSQTGDYDYEEIAAMLGTARGTVKWRVSEARRRVRAHLSQVGYDRV